MLHRSFAAFFGLSVGLTVLATPPVLAAGNVPSASDFIQQSDLIFIGTVVDQVALLDSKTGLIRTRYEFRVDHYLKGGGTEQLAITELGGQVDGLRLIVSHGVSYTRRGKYVVFAGRSEHGLRTIGGTQGRLPLIQNSGSTETVRMGPRHPLRGNSATFFLSLQELETRVREAEVRR